jgi:uncharacterized protein
MAAMCDLIIGTSTGRILSMRLIMSDPSGRPKFTAHQLVQLYSTNGADIFEPWPSSLLDEASEEATFNTLMIQAMLPQAAVHARQQTRAKPVPWWKAIFPPKYTAECVESFLHQQFGDAALSRPVAGTHLAVTSFNLAFHGLQILHSWEVQQSSSWHFPLWAVGRAAGTAPIYFPPAQVTSVNGTTTLECIDGGVAVNDPVLVAYAEARQLQRTLSGAAA